MPTQNEKQERILPQQHTGVVDSGATHLYIAPTVPYGPPDTRAAKVKVVTANGQFETSAAKATLRIPRLAADFPTTRYIVPSFTTTLIGVGPIYDSNCTVVFKKKYVTVISPDGKTILTEWRKKKLPRLWRFTLKSNNNIITDYTTTNQTTSAAHSAYDLTIIEDIVRYMHEASGLPFKSTWLKAIKKGNFETWPGLTYSNAAKYFPHAVKTIKGYMVQLSQGVRSTKEKKYQSRCKKTAPDQAIL